MGRPRHPPLAKWYRDYLSTQHWLSLRERILDKRGRKCQDCGSRWKPTCHHLTYCRLGHERMGDLRILCPKCHRQAHRWHDVPFLFLIYREDYEMDVAPILTVNRMNADFEYPRMRKLKT